MNNLYKLMGELLGSKVGYYGRVLSRVSESLEKGEELPEDVKKKVIDARKDYEEFKELLSDIAED